MQDPNRTRRDATSPADLGVVARCARRVSTRLRPAFGLTTRLGVLLTVVVALAVPFQSSQSVAFATHTLQTPTATPWGYNQGQTGTGLAGTPTPTPYGYQQYQPAQSQTQYQDPSSTSSGSQPNVTYPGMQQDPQYSGVQQDPQYSGVPGQQSVSSSVGAPVPGSAPGAPSGSEIVPGAASPMPGGDVCHGDELISFSPETPRIGNELLIAVTSSRPHPYGRLAGTEPTKFVRERPGQRGYVWEWTVDPTYPGQHEYVFYVDSTVPCQKTQIRVLQSLATRTPTPTKTATPWGGDNGNSNGNSNNNFNDNNNFAYPTSTAYAPVVDPATYVYQGYDLYQCSTFESQSNAQRVLRYDPTDPNNLDIEDGTADGIACLSASYPLYPTDRDTTPVPRITQTPTATLILTATPTVTSLPSQTPTQTPTQTATQTPTRAPAAFDPRTYLGQGDHYGCADFASQANAQAVLRADPTDPNRLDTSRDGLACGGIEASADGVTGGFMPAPFDGVRVARP